MTVNHGVLGSSPCSGASRGRKRLVVRAESFLGKRQSLSKIAQRFAENKILLTFAPPEQQSGSLAQLVQSICLTSRGSAVRIRQLPQKQKAVVYDRFFVFVNNIYIPSPLSPPFVKGRGLVADKACSKLFAVRLRFLAELEFGAVAEIKYI